MHKTTGIRPGIHVGGRCLPRFLATGIGSALQAADAMVELGAEGVDAAARRADRAARDARLRLGRAVGSAADRAAGWTERQVVRRVARSLTPYLIDELVPEVIDGVLPKIRADVVPVVVEDLAGDDRIRAMIAQQSRGMLTWSVTEVRRASADADDRVETSLRRLFGHRSDRP